MLKGKSYLCTGLSRPLHGSWRLRHPEFLGNRHTKVVRLSALLTDRLYPPGKIPVTHFCYRGWVDPRAIVRPEELSQWMVSMTQSGIKPATFRLVAQCNQLHHRVKPILLPKPQTSTNVQRCWNWLFSFLVSDIKKSRRKHQWFQPKNTSLSTGLAEDRDRYIYTVTESRLINTSDNLFVRKLNQCPMNGAV